ncbi:MAG: hypothetical protein ACRD12_03315 [Acidimicrobiales bacterium]
MLVEMVQALFNAEHPEFGLIQAALVLNAQSRHLVRVDPVVALIVALGRNLAMANSEEDGGARNARASDCLGHLHAIGHTAKRIGLLGTTAVELVANHPHGRLDHRQIRLDEA